MPSKPWLSIKYPFAIDPAAGRLANETDYPSHVEQLIKQVLMTSPGERINRPDFGCGLRRMLFAPNSDVSAALAQVSIREALDRWLSSVISVDGVTVTTVEETASIRVAYILKTNREKRFINLEVTP